MTFFEDHLERGWQIDCGRCANVQFMDGGVRHAVHELKALGWTSEWIDHYNRRRVLCPACSKDLL